MSKELYPPKTRIPGTMLHYISSLGAGKYEAICDCGKKAVLNYPQIRNAYSCGCTRRNSRSAQQDLDIIGFTTEPWPTNWTRVKLRTLTVLGRDSNGRWEYACSCCAGIFLMPIVPQKRDVPNRLRDLAKEPCPKCELYFPLKYQHPRGRPSACGFVNGVKGEGFGDGVGGGLIAVASLCGLASGPWPLCAFKGEPFDPYSAADFLAQLCYDHARVERDKEGHVTAFIGQPRRQVPEEIKTVTREMEWFPSAAPGGRPYQLSRQDSLAGSGAIHNPSNAADTYDIDGFFEDGSFEDE